LFLPCVDMSLLGLDFLQTRHTELSSHRQSPSKWVCVDLSSFVLGELYRAMYLFSFDPKQSHGGPLWLMQMWAYSYFPTIAPELYPTREPKSYGRPGCMLGMLAKSPASLPTSHFLVIPPGSDCLRILCFLRLKGMAEDFKSFMN
jgi:hypothetical protein